MKKITLSLLFLFVFFLGYAQVPKDLVLMTNNQENNNPIQVNTENDFCGHETLSNDFETRIGSLKNYNIANDFIINESMGIFTLESITFHAFVEPGGDVDSVDYTFYEDSGSGPGNLITSLEGIEPTSVELIGEVTIEGTDEEVLKVYYELEEPIIFESGDTNTTYWMGVKVPDYTGSSISFELISYLDNDNGTYVFLAGSWRKIETLFNVIRDGVFTLTGTCSVAEECIEAEAGNLTAPESVCPQSEFMITANDASSGIAGITYSWEQSPIDVEDWNVIEGAESINLTMHEGITLPTKFRLTVICEFGNSDTSIPVEVNLNPSELCYCVPEYTMGCDDGDTISQVLIVGANQEVLFQNDSSCSEDGYGDYTEELDSPELLQGETYTITITTASEDPTDENVRVWIDFNDDGIFATEEEIGNTNGDGMDESGQLSFEVTIPEDIEIGSYRLRARLAWLGSEDMDPCERRSYGETEDYTIQIVENLGVENSEFHLFSFYPNPMDNELHIKAVSPIDNLIVYNLLGQELIQLYPNNSKAEILTHKLPTGVYLMQVTIKGTTETFKLIKN